MSYSLESFVLDRRETLNWLVWFNHQFIQFSILGTGLFELYQLLLGKLFCLTILICINQTVLILKHLFFTPSFCCVLTTLLHSPVLFNFSDLHFTIAQIINNSGMISSPCIINSFLSIIIGMLHISTTINKQFTHLKITHTCRVKNTSLTIIILDIHITSSPQ